MPEATSPRDTVTLRGRGGLSLILFAPRILADGALEADALYAPTAIPRGRLLRLGDHKYRAPAIPGPAFHVARLTLPEVS